MANDLDQRVPSRRAPAQRVLIVGGGPAGMTAAIALHRRGIEWQIVELDPSWASEGIGLFLQPPAVRALKSLDLLEACADVGYRCT